MGCPPPCRRAFDNFKKQFLSSQVGECVTGFSWVEARDTAGHPTMHRQSLRQESSRSKRQKYHDPDSTFRYSPLLINQQKIVAGIMTLHS